MEYSVNGWLKVLIGVIADALQRRVMLRWAGIQSQQWAPDRHRVISCPGASVVTMECAHCLHTLLSP